jgi:hypothetical protein
LQETSAQKPEKENGNPAKVVEFYRRWFPEYMDGKPAVLPDDAEEQIKPLLACLPVFEMNNLIGRFLNQSYRKKAEELSFGHLLKFLKEPG